MKMGEERAVIVRNGVKTIGKSKILKDFNMQVKKGTIYGLLGASGCGKTTLVHCLIGRKRFDSGQLCIFSSSLSYMPQEFGLAKEFNSRDVVFYFGRILQLDDASIEHRYEYLCKLLDLPPTNRLIKHCSGGEQRRISLAAALVSIPELLILDEPTIGIGPILREKIWNYLVEITREHKTTVILTTHYIQETIRADTIGLMRHGRLLSEKSPQELLQEYQTQYLDDIFLTLSQKQEDNSLEYVNNLAFDAKIEPVNNLKKNQWYKLNGKRLLAASSKSFKQFYRNIPTLCFALIFPAIQTLFFLVTVGTDPNDLPLAIVNQDSNCTTLNSRVHLQDGYCHFQEISCRFLQFLDNPMIERNYWSGDLEAAKHSVVKGTNLAVLYIGHNFTEAFENKFNSYGTTHVIYDPNADIKVWIDLSNRQTGGCLKYRLYNLYKEFQKELVTKCEFNEKLYNLFNQEVYFGDLDEPVTQAMAPGYILTNMLLFAILVSCHTVLEDALEGLWDRSATAGLTTMEIIMGHSFLLLAISMVHTIEMLAVTFLLLDVQNYGSFTLVTLIVFLQGVLGISIGFCISTISTNLTIAQGLAMSIGMFNIFGSGFMWPFEGMPKFMQWSCILYPSTLPLKALRDVMKKNWDLTQPDVYYGVVTEIGWIIVPLIISILFINNKR